MRKVSFGALLLIPAMIFALHVNSVPIAHADEDEAAEAASDAADSE